MALGQIPINNYRVVALAKHEYNGYSRSLVTLESLITRRSKTLSVGPETDVELNSVVRIRPSFLALFRLKNYELEPLGKILRYSD